MEKKWKDLQIGDYIWYYDHYKLHKQKITHISRQQKIDEIDSLFYKKTINITNEIYIEAGKGTKMYISHYFNTDEYWWGHMPRFANYEAAKRFIERLIHYRKERINKFKNKYERELKMLEKYEV